jgi:hypothetical protein
MVDGIDEHGYAEHVGQQDELLVLVAGALVRGGQKPDRGEPFVLGDPLHRGCAAALEARRKHERPLPPARELTLLAFCRRERVLMSTSTLLERLTI